MVLNGLPECLCDLHDGMPPAIQQTPMRLLKIKAVLTWKILKAYEDVEPETECHQLPYMDTDDDLWKRVVTVSWRWSEQKPAEHKKDFSPMSNAQFQELCTLLKFAGDNGIDYVWIDWSCVPQYSEDSMVEVHRSKVFYARARAMRVLPTFRPLPAEGPVRLILVKAKKVLSKRADAGSVRCAVASSIVAAILAKNMVAGREYFGRVWTLAERMARFGRNEGLCQWLSLESWLGMVVDAMLKSTEDKTSSVIYKKMLGTKAAGLLDAVLDPLAAAVRTGSVQARACEGLETRVAELCMAAVSVWLSPSLLAEAPTSNWLHNYLGVEARSGVYQAWNEADRVWAIYSYFCWKQNLDQRSAEGLRIALEDLVEVAAGDRSVYVRGMFAQLRVDENATPVMEIVPQPGKPSRPSSSRSASTRPPSARTQEEIERRKKEEEAIAAAAERRRKEEAALTASIERRRLEEEAAAAAAAERRRQEEAAAAAASERRKAEEAAATAAVTARQKQEEAAAAAAAERRKLEEAAEAAALERKKQEEAAAAAAAARKKKEEEAAAAAAAEKKKQEEMAAAIAAGKPTPGAKVTIKYVSIDVAKVAQSGHGGWTTTMEKMLGKTGVVESVDKDGDVRVKLDDGSGSMLWNPSLITLGGTPAAVVLPSALSSARIGKNAALNDKYTVRFVTNSSDVGAVQADFPAPASSLVYYFEMTVVEPGAMGTIGLGYAPSSHDTSHHVGWDSGTFGFHGDDGNTFFEGRAEYYGFKYGKGDVVGAALDFQRKEIFFTKNGTKGKAISVNINNLLYPTVSLHSVGEVVSVNFGQKPFAFNTEPYKIKVGDKVAIKNIPLDAAKAAQAGHGGWGSSMDKMLGKTGVVESIDKDGDVRVKMDDGSGSMLWNPVLVVPNAAALSPLRAGVRVTIKSVSVSEAQASQSGHGGWATSMEKMLGKTGVVESVDKDGDVRVKMDDGSGSMLWNPSLITLGGAAPAPEPATAPSPSAGQIAVGAKVSIKAVPVSEAQTAQSGHGGWVAAMEKMLGMPGVVESIDKDGDVKVKMDAGGDSKLWNPKLVLPGVVMPTTSLSLGSKAYIKNLSVEEAKAAQDGHGGWNSNMGKYLGKIGTLSYKYSDGDVKVKFEGGDEYCWYWGLVLPAPTEAATPAKPSFSAGAKVTIKSVSVDEAKAAQSGHGGWATAMEKMLGKTGVVVSVDKDGDVNVKMDADGDTKLWNPSLLILGGSGLSTASLSVGSKATIKCVRVDEAKAAQDGHGGWSSNMGKYLGKSGDVSFKFSDGDVKIKFASGDEYCWSHELVLPGTPTLTPTSYEVGTQVMISNVTVDDAKAAQDGHGGWNSSMGNYLGKVGTVSYKYSDGDMKVKFDGNEYCWFWGLVGPAPTGGTSTGGGTSGSTGACTPGAHKGVWRGPETKYWCSTSTMTEGPLCTHGAAIIKAPHWSCCGAKEKCPGCTRHMLHRGLLVLDVYPWGLGVAPSWAPNPR
ncbi:hypothetical protein VOLCADRAFT_103851 [Volvox carteri f. nagariensis]|uniref:B30.2/SPRY domain-containing protein n=1 Tax=Volvox carteri f. nagariensis TaxID=3068 RepID=D8TPM5_VOLCA|nr:uncharacterized protein VOLCADRAFT_103851 [Volvox carteri f. nagariensis]EFJ50789.1 hypothetical protein VOLCADRAFT_103851 [Volvox carteri f. nagariensis]|eukprot:XP_002948382.1 hypothetical protein VOLCADRAFT_103851 [Volvox carteri f. nagariensis]